VSALVQRFTFIQLGSQHEIDGLRSASSTASLQIGEANNSSCRPLSLHSAKTDVGLKAAWTDGGGVCGDADKDYCIQDFVDVHNLVERVFQRTQMYDLLLTHHGCYALAIQIHLKMILLPPVIDICESYLTADSRVSTCYVLDADSLGPGEWDKHKNALTWYPSPRLQHSAMDTRLQHSAMCDVVALDMWSEERGSCCRLPTAYAWRHFGPAVHDLRWTKTHIPVERATAIVGDIEIVPHRPDFQTICAAIENAIAKRQYGGTIQIPPGYGKVRIPIQCICMSRARSIILTDSRSVTAHLANEITERCPLLRITSMVTPGQCFREEYRKNAMESDVLIASRRVVDRILPDIAMQFERVYVCEYELVQPATLVDWFGRWAPRAWIGIGTGQERMDGGHKVAELLFGESLFRVST
jgi:hypothetical protein